MAKFDTSPHFRVFAGQLEAILDVHEKAEDPDEELLVRQRRQLKRLIGLEIEFRDSLYKHPWGANVYRDFFVFILDTKKNLLAARPYFRERHEIFKAGISRFFRKRDIEGFRSYRLNWSFVEWVLRSRRWPVGSKIRVLAKSIADQRQEILEQNLPLALSQARMFWNNTPQSHLSYMDIVQLQAQGLLLAADKFVPPDDSKMSERQSLAAYKNFRAVAIGIMTRDRVNAYSETLIHFYPKDRAKIYRALKALRRTFGEVDFDALASQITDELKTSGIKTDGNEIRDLLAAVSSPLNTPFDSGTEATPASSPVVDTFAGPEALRPDSQFEDAENRSVLRNTISVLRTKEQKLLKLKGVRP